MLKGLYSKRLLNSLFYQSPFRAVVSCLGEISDVAVGWGNHHWSLASRGSPLKDPWNLGVGPTAFPTRMGWQTSSFWWYSLEKALPRGTLGGRIILGKEWIKYWKEETRKIERSCCGWIDHQHRTPNWNTLSWDFPLFYPKIYHADTAENLESMKQLKMKWETWSLVNCQSATPCLTNRHTDTEFANHIDCQKISSQLLS